MEKVVQDLAQGATAKSHDVTVLCTAHENKDSEEIINGVHVIRRKAWRVIASQPISWPFIKTLPSAIREADIIHHHAPNPLVEVALLLLKKRKTKIVITHHSDIVRQKWLAKIYYPIQVMLYALCDKIIVPTENHIRYSRILRPFKKKCEIIPFGLDTSNYPKNEVIKKIAEGKNKQLGPYILFIGRAVSYKGIDYLLQAMTEVSSNLLLIGDGPLKEELQEQAHDLGISKRVHFLGKIESQDEFCAFLQGSKLLVLPSITKNENFGMVQLEAMFYQRPIVTTSIKSGASTIVTEGETGLKVPPQDPKSLAKALNLLMSNDILRHKMGIKGLERYNQEYTFEKMISKHMSLYAQLLESGSPKKADKKSA